MGEQAEELAPFYIKYVSPSQQYEKWKPVSRQEFKHYIQEYTGDMYWMCEIGEQSGE